MTGLYTGDISTGDVPCLARCPLLERTFELGYPNLILNSMIAKYCA
jgi:hypothetical protein